MKVFLLPFFATTLAIVVSCTSRPLYYREKELPVPINLNGGEGLCGLESQSGRFENTNISVACQNSKIICIVSALHCRVSTPTTLPRQPFFFGGS
jgi:hypothetical protein